MLESINGVSVSMGCFTLSGIFQSRISVMSYVTTGKLDRRM
jgi:hypothetical protein